VNAQTDEVKLSVVHYRVDAATGKVRRWFRGLEGGNGFIPDPHGGITYAYINIDGKTAVGRSDCSKHDAYCYSIGRAIAVGRAVQDARKQLFDEYKIRLAVPGLPARHRFDRLYSRFQDVEEIPYRGSTLIRHEEERPCWHCQRQTKWIDINFEAFLCCPECEDAKWDEYFKAQQDSGDAVAHAVENIKNA
jgi:hypothetical protein